MRNLALVDRLELCPEEATVHVELQSNVRLTPITKYSILREYLPNKSFSKFSKQFSCMATPYIT